jgi:hypothetical protein
VAAGWTTCSQFAAEVDDTSVTKSDKRFAACHLIGMGGGVDQLECEADNCLQCNDKFRNQRSLPPLIHMPSCLGDSDTLTFIVILLHYVTDKVRMKLKVLGSCKSSFLFVISKQTVAERMQTFIFRERLFTLWA